MCINSRVCSVAQTAQTAQQGREALGLFKATAGAPVTSIAALVGSPFVLMGDAEGNMGLLQVKVSKVPATVEVKRVVDYPAHTGSVLALHKLPVLAMPSNQGTALMVASSGRGDMIKVWRVERGATEPRKALSLVAHLSSSGSYTACAVIKGRTGGQTEPGFTAICGHADGTLELLYTWRGKDRRDVQETTFRARPHASAVSRLGSSLRGVAPNQLG
jgi:hypothetical protein